MAKQKKYFYVTLSFKNVGFRIKDTGKKGAFDKAIEKLSKRDLRKMLDLKHCYTEQL